MKYTLFLGCFLLAVLVWTRLRDSKRALYFAYGANTNIEYFKKRIPSAVYLGLGVLPHYDFKWEYSASLERDPENKVEGVLWELPVEDLSKLDTFEKNYTRLTESVMFNSRLVEAELYIRNDIERKPKNLKKYIRRVKKGYRENGLPMEQIDPTS